MPVSINPRQTTSSVPRKVSARTALLDAALTVIRTKGYAGTTVDDLCKAAEVTKGAFFHHFESKEALAVAAATHFAEMADGLFLNAPYRELSPGLERLRGYIAFRRAILQGTLPQFTCLLGTMVQETFDTHPVIREACNTHISAHAAMVSEDIALARSTHAPDAPWSAESLGLFTQAVLQGSFILAKAKHGPEVADHCVAHLERYVELLFNVPSASGPGSRPLHPMTTLHQEETLL